MLQTKVYHFHDAPYICSHMTVTANKERILAIAVGRCTHVDGIVQILFIVSIRHIHTVVDSRTADKHTRGTHLVTRGEYLRDGQHRQSDYCIANFSHLP